MIFEQLKKLEKSVEGNEYFRGGVGYYFSVDKLDESISLKLALKQRLLEIKAIELTENITLTIVDNPQDDINTICENWNFDKTITNEIQNLIDDTTNVYRCCADYQYISKGCVCDIFRIIVKNGKLFCWNFILLIEVIVHGHNFAMCLKHC